MMRMGRVIADFGPHRACFNDPRGGVLQRAQGGGRAGVGRRWRGPEGHIEGRAGANPPDIECCWTDSGRRPAEGVVPL